MAKEVYVAEAAGTPITRKGSWSGSDSDYQEVLSYTVPAGPPFSICELTIDTDNYSVTEWRITINTVQWYDETIPRALTMRWLRNKVPAAAVIKVEAKSDGSTTVATHAELTGETL